MRVCTEEKKIMDGDLWHKGIREKRLAALHTKSVVYWELCEAKCIKGELVVNYAQNADAR